MPATAEIETLARIIRDGLSAVEAVISAPRVAPAAKAACREAETTSLSLSRLAAALKGAAPAPVESIEDAGEANPVHHDISAVTGLLAGHICFACRGWRDAPDRGRGRPPRGAPPKLKSGEPSPPALAGCGAQRVPAPAPVRRGRTSSPRHLDPTDRTSTMTRPIPCTRSTSPRICAEPPTSLYSPRGR